MGLLEQMRDRAVEQRGAAWVRSDGSRRAEMPVTAFDGSGLVSKLEILRGDLVDVLYQATKDRADYRFNTRISELEQDDDAVSGDPRRRDKLRADLIVGADSPAFRVAALCVRARGAVRQTAWRLQRVVFRPRPCRSGRLVPAVSGGLNASMRPSHDPAIAKARLAFRSELLTYDRRDLDQQRQLLVDRFAGAGWHCDEIANRCTQADDYFDSFRRCRWIPGLRVVSRSAVTPDTAHPR